MNFCSGVALLWSLITTEYYYKELINCIKICLQWGNNNLGVLYFVEIIV